MKVHLRDGQIRESRGQNKRMKKAIRDGLLTTCGRIAAIDKITNDTTKVECKKCKADPFFDWMVIGDNYGNE